MSGGHFDYLQYQITEAAEDVDRMIRDFESVYYK